MFNLAIVATTFICAIPLIFLLAFGLTVAFGIPALITTAVSAVFFGAAGWIVIKGIATGK